MAFDNAHDFSIGNAIFQNNTFSAPTLHDAQATKILLWARAVEATHTSTTASYAPKCNPETRLKVIGDIADWVVSPTEALELAAATRLSILWFSGPAGSGKTCIMRSVIDRSIAAGLSTLSYFFSTRGSGLSKERPFVATIVDQLITLHPVLRPRVVDTIRNRPGIFEESLDVQMDKLVIETLESQDIQSQPIPLGPKRIVIIIDGFDECDSERERKHLLTLLLTLIRRLPHLIIVVLASRPELDIRTAFEDPKTLKNITKVLRLQDYDGREDVRIFLCDEFEKIRTTHPLRRSIPANWPLEEIVQILLDKSSRNFIYPATVIKYIQNPRRNPIALLEEVLALSKAPTPGNANPLAELDALYYHILHPADTTDQALTKRILHCIIVITGTLSARTKSIISPSFLDQFLGLSPDTTRATLCDLHSLLSVPDSDDTSPIQLHHKSLEDYLLSERSLDMFRSPYETYLDLTTICIGHLQRWARHPVIDESRCLKYSAGYWGYALLRCIQNKPASAILPDVIVNMDPRVVLGYIYVHDLVDPYGLLSYSLKGPLLSLPELRGSRLGQLVTRIHDCARKMLNHGHLRPDPGVARLKWLARFESEIGLYAPLKELSSQPVIVEPNHGVATSHVISGNAQSLSSPESRRPSLEAEASTSSLPLLSSAAMTPSVFENSVQSTSRVDRAANRGKRRFSRTCSPSPDVDESDHGVATPYVISGNTRNLRSRKSRRLPLEAEDSIGRGLRVDSGPHQHSRSVPSPLLLGDPKSTWANTSGYPPSSSTHRGTPSTPGLTARFEGHWLDNENLSLG